MTSPQNLAGVSGTAWQARQLICSSADKHSSANLRLSAWTCPLNLLELNMQQVLTGVCPEHTVACEHMNVES